jgi:hypothetical protein
MAAVNEQIDMQEAATAQYYFGFFTSGNPTSSSQSGAYLLSFQKTLDQRLKQESATQERNHQ